MKEISLLKGRVTLVDDEDYANLDQWRWNYKKIKGKEYVKRSKGNWRERKDIFLHRYLMNPPKEMFVDHIDGNGLNNQRKNLRICTKAQNTWNRLKSLGKSSKFKGVTWEKSRKKWLVTCYKDGKMYHLGRYENEEDAAKVYDTKAKELFGEYAKLNF